MRKTSPVLMVLLALRLFHANRLVEPDDESNTPTATIVPHEPVAVGHSTAELFVACAPVVVNAQLCRAYALPLSSVPPPASVGAVV